MTMIEDWSAAKDLLKGRIILVSGAGAGIGRAAAIEFAALGATVILLDKDIPALERVYDSIEATGCPTPAIYPLNLESATPRDYDDLALKLEEAFGRLDGILHNAALLGALSPIAHHDVELWQQILHINLTAPFLLTRSCLGLLGQSGDASIIFTTDATGHQGKAYWGAYSVSKAGLENLAQILAQELESNSPVRVNCVDPGPTATALRTIAYPAETHPPKQPHEVLKPFIYLMSTDARGISGQRFRSQ